MNYVTGRFIIYQFYHSQQHLYIIKGSFILGAKAKATSLLDGFIENDNDTEFYVVRNGLHGYQCYWSKMTTEKVTKNSSLSSTVNGPLMYTLGSDKGDRQKFAFAFAFA